MKSNRKLNWGAILINLLLAFIVGGFLAVAADFNPIVTTTTVFAIGTGLQLVGMKMPEGAFLAGVYREIWTGQLIESFRPNIDASFLNHIPSYDEYVQSSSGGENQVIHLVDIGADPEVLLNNTTYPIGYSTLPDGDIAFQLDKYQTVATKVTDDELYAITYDKMAKVNEKHSKAILEKKFGKAAHALAPQSNTAATPVLATTGATVGGKKLCSVDDIIDLGAAMSAAGVPDDGQRILVLNSTHVSGILKEVKNFYRDYANIESGQVKSLFYGFKVYVYHNNPFYVAATNVKASYGAVFNPGTHNVASFAFYAPDMFRAQGDTKMYYDEPGTQNQESAVNYRHYYLVSPLKARAIAALVTANA